MRVTVTVGPYATVRAIEKSGLTNLTHMGLIKETARHYTYEIEGYPTEHCSADHSDGHHASGSKG